ncbi:MAG: TrbI/VirB10 family protein [Proteobacteria bacterium]|nr:TrbI/VirB10 family protein [Pseudomonadota bacterium]
MKSKPIKRPDPDLEQDDDDIEVESGAPEVAAGKQSKFVLVVVSTLLTVAVLYFFFFKDNSSKENLEKIEVPQPVGIATSDSGKSPFELELPKEESSKVDVDILSQPSSPDLPTLPELPENAVIPDKIDLTSDQKKPEQQLPPQQQQQQLELQQKPNQQNSSTEQQQDGQKKSDPRYAPIVIFSGATDSAVPPRGVGYDNNIVSLKNDPINDLQATTTSVVATRIADLTHTIAQGKLLNAVLETAINTELPGSVRAVVSRDVYGESGNEILIPKGSRLFGAYSSKVNRGQARVEIGWTRLIRPDGVDMIITFNASDQFGRSGIPGEIDNKYSSIITSSMLTSVLAIGGVAAAQKLLTNNTATTTTTNPTQGTTTTTGSATNQALYDVTKTIIDTVGQLLSNSIDLTPVIRVPQGTKITVIVNSDITIPSARK